MAKDNGTKSHSTFIEAYSEKRGICITVIILGVMIGIFAFAYIAFGNDTIVNPQIVKSTVVLVSIVSQHGSVAPVVTYPGDPYKNDTFWPFGRGELTKKGRQNAFNLGKFLRDRYAGFLPELYFPKDVNVLSSDTNRCYMSAALVLAGLYPPHKFQVWNPHLMWQPIPVRIIPGSMDKMLDVKKNCSSLQKELSFLENSVSNNRTTQELYRYILQNTGLNDDDNNNGSSISTLYHIYEMLFIQKSSGFELPEWTNSIYPEKLTEYAVQYLQMFTKNPTVRRLGSGVLLDDVLQHMISKSKNITIPKVFLYSVNGVTIFKLLRGLNVQIADTNIPNYGSTIMIELHNITGKYHLEIFYLEKSSSRDPMPLNITGCESPCSLDSFNHIAKELIPSSWEKECQLISR